jgi:hypothetical protein
MQVVKVISESTGVLSTLFSVVGMTAASTFLWFRPERFTADNWLEALMTCAGLIGGVVVKRTIDNTRLAKNGVGDQGQ